MMKWIKTYDASCGQKYAALINPRYITKIAPLPPDCPSAELGAKTEIEMLYGAQFFVAESVIDIAAKLAIKTGAKS